MRNWLGLALLAAGVVCALPAGAQQARGSLNGTVSDATGARVAGAAVEATQAGTAVARQIHADAHGAFHLPALAPGGYQLTVSAPGFAPAQATVQVLVGSPRTVAVRLTPAAAAQQVTVRGEASSITTQPLDTTSAVLQGVVTAQDLQTIPLAARSFANIAYLTPGTEPVEPSDPTKAPITV